MIDVQLTRGACDYCRRVCVRVRRPAAVSYYRIPRRIAHAKDSTRNRTKKRQGSSLIDAVCYYSITATTVVIRRFQPDSCGAPDYGSRVYARRRRRFLVCTPVAHKAPLAIGQIGGRGVITDSCGVCGVSPPCYGPISMREVAA